mmetsp:Transcript_2274/g.9794  ORF Transcript_2274/g.9794 Transcript_2274/m.9794 type:complete len:236 (-) Transcript_2274:133-840(-)|eukprot:scaffold193_cov255-Pinguiococcus_pyrenoidosus.AAC.39
MQAPVEEPSKRTLQPVCTGGAVVAIKYAGGVMSITDTLVSYGRMARYRDVQRVFPLADGKAIIAGGGEHSDFQQLVSYLDDLGEDDYIADDGYELGTEEYYNYIRAVLYQQRNKFEPLWNDVVIGGLRGGKPFLGTVNLIGLQYEEDYIATGFGGYLVTPILRTKWRPDLTEDEARALLEECMRVLFYRFCTALNRVHLAKVTEEGAVISEPYLLQNLSWNLRAFVEPKSTEGDW